MPEEVRNIGEINTPIMEEYLWKRFKELRETQFDASKPNVIIVGDSQAADVVNMLAENGYDEQANIKTFQTDVRCGTVYVAPEDSERYWTVENVRTVREPQFVNRCATYLEAFFTDPSLSSADLIIIANLWAGYSIPYLGGTIRKIETLSEAPVVVFGRKDLRYSSPDLLSRFGRLHGLERWARSQENRETTEINRLLKREVGTHYFDAMNSLSCGPEECEVLDPGNRPVFFDTAHLTPEGAGMLGGKLLDTGILPAPSKGVASIR